MRPWRMPPSPPTRAKSAGFAPPNSVKVACDGKVVAVRTFEDGSLSFPTQVGQSYIVTLR